MTAVYESAFAVALNDHPIDLAMARQVSHDQVIANTGRARRSGVSWTERPVVEWRATLEELGIPIDPNRPKVETDVEVLAERFPAGVLVLATVLVDPEVTP